MQTSFAIESFVSTQRKRGGRERDTGLRRLWLEDRSQVLGRGEGSDRGDVTRHGLAHAGHTLAAGAEGHDQMQGLLVKAQGVETVRGYGVKPPHPAFFLLLPLRSVGCAFESSKREVWKTTGLSEVLGHRGGVTVQDVEHMLGNASAELTPGFANIADMTAFTLNKINNASI